MLELANPARWRKVRRDALPTGPGVYLARRADDLGEHWAIGSALDLRRDLRRLEHAEFTPIAYLPCGTAAEALELEAEAHRRAEPLRNGAHYARASQ